MGRLLVLATMVAASAEAVAMPDAPADATALTEEERVACAGELSVLENRRRLFRSEGLPAPEQQRRNAAAEQALRDCRRELEERRRQEAERDGGKPLLVQYQSRERQRKLDAEHARDPRFMRPAHSGMVCYHYARKARAEASLAGEERTAGPGKPDRTSSYRARAERVRAERGLAAGHRALAEFGAPIRCDDRTVSMLAHCIAVRNGDLPEDRTCAAEEVQQYLRLLR